MIYHPLALDAASDGQSGRRKVEAKRFVLLILGRE
jgi:hypothetical protein